MADHWGDFDVHYAETIEPKTTVKWSTLKCISHERCNILKDVSFVLLSLHLLSSSELSSAAMYFNTFTLKWHKHLRDLKSFWPCLATCDRVTSSSGAHHSTGNFHSSNRNIFIWYWIWIWIDWFSLGRSGDWCLKRCSVKTYSSFWPVQRKARVFL